MSKKAKKHKPTPQGSLPPLKVPQKFNNFHDNAQWAKQSVYFIARLRPTGKEGEFKVLSLGTGFIAARGRFLTCAHVVSNPKSKDPMGAHKDGDKYVLVRRVDGGDTHVSAQISAELNMQLFIYPECDLAVLYLPESFYKRDKNSYFVHPDQKLKITTSTRGIGASVGVLGYPLQTLLPDENGALNVQGVMIRADMGIVNIRYNNNSIETYEFTIAFNQGNSGGPIIDAKTGHVVGIVHASRTHVSGIHDMDINEAQKKDWGVEELRIPIAATYSIGIATSNFADIFKQHQISFSS